MLTYEEKDYLISRLAAHIGGGGFIRQTLVAPFIGTPFAQQIPDLGDVRALVLSTINLCNTDGWRMSPSALRLLFGGLGLAILDAKLAEIDSRITAIEIALKEEANRLQVTGVNPFQATVLGGTMPFVNRTALRQQLALLAAPGANQHPILIVEGGEKSGKSYSCEYIDYIKNLHPIPITTYLLKFDREAGLEEEAADLARDFVSLMGRQIVDIPNNTNEKRYTKDLAVWVLNAATQVAATQPIGSQHWLILDNYGGTTLQPDTRSFLAALSSEVTNGVFQRQCRLILLGVDRDIVAVSDNRIIEDKTRPCTRPEVEATLSEILSRTPTVGLAVVAPFVFDNLPTDTRKMWELNRRLRLLMIAVNRLVSLSVEPPDFKIEDLLPTLLANLPELIIQPYQKLKDLESRRIEGVLNSQLDDLENHLLQLRPS